MKSPKTILTIQQLAELREYSDVDKVTEEASKAGILFEYAGAPHICLEEWDANVLRAFNSKVSERSKTGKTLADTKQIGILKSNLKRLPDIIKKKERRLKAIEALLKDATSDDEIYSLRGEKSTLETDLERHRKNLEDATQGLKRVQAERRAMLDDLEANDSAEDGGPEEGATPVAEPVK